MGRYDAGAVELIQGDVCETVPKILGDNPETIIALAIFDLDLYKPTLACLEAIKNNIAKGTILVFDQISDPEWPGETLALKQSLGLRDLQFQRLSFLPRASFIEI